MRDEEPQPSTSLGEEPQASTSSDEEPPSSSSGAALEDDEPPTKRRLNVKEINSQWNLVKIFLKLGTREKAIAFAEDRGMIPRQKVCNYHKKEMLIDFSTNKTVGSFTCYRRPCKGKSRVTRAKGTWFENVKITMSQIFYIMYAYSAKWSYNTTIKEDFTEGVDRLSTATVKDWFDHCRAAVVTYQKDRQGIFGKIGGPGKVVQIDESKLGKRKLHKGDSEGHWVLGMIEEGSEDLRLEVCPETVLSAEVLVPLIQKHVAEGTTIRTGFWQAYDGCEKFGYIHQKVNNSDPDNTLVANRTHSQQIEKQWRILKGFFSKDSYSNSENFTDLIFEYLWRRDNYKYKRDPFEELINVINYSFNK